MACSCNQKSVPPRGSQAARDAADRAKAAAEARAANPSAHRIGPAVPSRTASAAGYALRDAQGVVHLFGSALERDAAAARAGLTS